MHATTSSCRKISVAEIMSRMRKTRTLKPFLDRMNWKRSSVAATTARMSNDFHSKGLEELPLVSGGSSADSEACSDTAAI